MSPLSITLFGTVQATIDGRLLTFPTDKCLALLAYLAVEAGRPQRRDTLAELLWPGHTDQAARTSLRQALYRLRTAIGDTGDSYPYLLASRRTVQFNPRRQLWLDVAEFEHCLDTFKAHCASGLPLCTTCLEALKTAAALYEGEFMSGFSLSTSPSYELWLVSRQERYRRQALEILGRLGSFYEKAGDFGQAAACARQLVALEPWRESSHRLLMRNLAQAGQRRAALAQYERCRQLMDEDLGVEPSNKTRQLYEQIRDQDGARAWPVEDRETAINRSSRPTYSLDKPALRRRFAGRGEELAKLEVHLVRVLAGQGRVLFIKGEAGSGKTSLAAEFCRRAMAADERLLVAYGCCDGQLGLGDPYQPFREALRMLSGQAGDDLDWPDAEKMPVQRLLAAKSSIKEILAEAGPDLPGTLLPDNGSREQPISRSDQAMPVETALFEQVTEVLLAVAHSHPLILVLDDLHWIDAVSASLLFHLGRHLAGSRLLIIGTYRPEEVDWAAYEMGELRRHPLLPTVNGLQRQHGEIQIDLDRANGRAFIEAYIDSEPNRLDKRFRDSLFERTGGNPLATVELMSGLKTREELARDEQGFWVVNKELDWELLPARVEAVISERMQRLTPNCQEILTVASVQGQTFLAEVAAAVAGKEAGPVIRCLSETLTHEHHLVEAGSRENHNGLTVSRYRFRHHLFQQFAYQQLDDVARSHIHEATGLALEAIYADQSAEHAAELARHFEAAGCAEKAARYLLTAGERAYLLSANAAAIAYFHRGLALLAKLPNTGDSDEKEQRARLELALQMALGTPLRAARGYAADEVRRSYARARDLARQIGDTDEQFMAQLLLWTSYLTRADYSKALDTGLQLQSLAQKSGNNSQMAEANLALGMVRFYQGEFSLAYEHLEATISSHDPQEQNLFLSPIGQNIGLTALTLSARALWFLGYPDQALKRCQLAIAQTEEMDHSYSLALSLAMAGCVVRLLRGEYQLVSSLSERLLRLAFDEGFDFFAAWAAIFQGRAQLFLGQKNEGLANLHQGLSDCQEINHISNMTLGLALLAEANAGDGEREKVLQDALALAENTGEQFFAAELQRLRGEVLFEGEDAPAAEACFREALEIARHQGAKALELRAATGLARLWQRQGQEQEAHRLLAGIVGWFTEGFETADLQEAQTLLEELRNGRFAHLVEGQEAIPKEL
ncbi:MAG: ATP-binding protein [Candidatus Promineifilaceae bacterium]